MPAINVLVNNQTGVNLTLYSITVSLGAHWSGAAGNPEPDAVLAGNGMLTCVLQASEPGPFDGCLVFQCDPTATQISPAGANASVTVGLAQTAQGGMQANWMAAQSPGSNLQTFINGQEDPATGNWQVVATITRRPVQPTTAAGA